MRRLLPLFLAAVRLDFFNLSWVEFGGTGIATP